MNPGAVRRLVKELKDCCGLPLRNRNVLCMPCADRVLCLVQAAAEELS